MNTISKHFTVTIAKKAGSFPIWRVTHFLLGFLHLQKQASGRAGTAGGGGSEGGNQLCLSRELQLLLQTGPREPIRSGCVRLCPKLCPWSAHYVEPPQSPNLAPSIVSRAAEPRGEGGSRPLSHGKPGGRVGAAASGAGSTADRAAPAIPTPSGGVGVRVGAPLEGSRSCKTVCSPPSKAIR